MNPKPVVERVADLLRKRSEDGAKEHGATMERTDKDTLFWLDEIQSEMMDGSIYAEKLKDMVAALYAENSKLRSENAKYREEREGISILADVAKMHLGQLFKQI